MIFNRSKKLKVISFLIIVLAIAVMPLVGIGDSPAQAAEPGQLAPINPDFTKFWENPPEPFYGYIPPPTDLSHLDEIPVERPRGFATLPSSFDWRNTGKVTSVKDQNPCGTCWCFGTTSAVESRVLIEESVVPEPDYSEQNLACCTDPAWVYLIGNRCMGGGNSFIVHNTLSKKGTRLEECQPYDTDTINGEDCDDSCQTIKRITDYRMVANSPSQIDEVKNAVSNHGPVSMAFYAEGEPWPHMYPGYIYYYPDCPQDTNHIVSIVGWDDGIVWPDYSGSGAWIVKNSWGTGWGDSGYFYLCYGSASMCEVVSFDYKDYDTNEKIYYWDEAGIVGAFGNWDDYSGWMANIFTSTQDGTLTHVDFWTTSNNAQYQIYVYRDGDISNGLQNLATSQSGSCQEFGYYSIPLSSPVSLTNAEAFTIAVKMTTTGYKYPIPAEYQYAEGGTTIVDPPIQSGESFYRHGDAESWTDIATHECNACLRARVTTGAAGQPDITVFPPSFDVTLGPSTSQDYTLNIGNAGDATLTYTISDVETTGPTAVKGDSGHKGLLSGSASAVLEVPLEGSPVKPEDTRGVGSGWQNIMSDDFEAAFPGADWNVGAIGGYTDAYWGKDSYRYYSPSYSVFCAKEGTDGVNPPADYPDDMNAWMVYGPFSLADATDAELNFNFWLAAEYEWDYLYYWASIDGYSFSGTYWTGYSDGWVEESFDLTDVYGLGNLCGQPQVWIAFTFQSDWLFGYEGAFIDDVVLRQYVAGANNAPNTPSNPSPTNHATGVSINADLSWSGGDPDAGDTVTYDVYFGTSGSPSLVSNDQSATSYDPGALSSGTKYYWKIVATDNQAASTTGPVWDFTTGGAAEDCLWLSEEPMSGSVAPGDPAHSITVTIDTTGLGSTYTANIVISSNDPDEPQVIVPVTLHVESATEAKWTVMVYLDADNNLEESGIWNFNEMEVAGSTEDVNIIVLMDRIPGYDISNGDWTGARLYRVTKDTDPDIIHSQLLQDKGEVNMGDPNTLIDFATWTIQHYPAEHYLLSLSNHGSGWKSSPLPIKGICWDDSSNGDYITSQELRSALFMIKEQSGIDELDILGFDACLMGMLEIDYQVMPIVNIRVGSEEIEYGGFNYADTLVSLTNTPTMAPNELATHIVNDYVAMIQGALPDVKITMSAVDLSQIGALANSVSNFATSMMNSGNWDGVAQARYQAEGYYYRDYIDLYDFARLIKQAISDAGVQSNADQVMTSVTSAVIAQGQNLHPNSQGISIYFPTEEYGYMPYYEDLAFANTQWDEFLHWYYDNSPSPQWVEFIADPDEGVNPDILYVDYSLTATHSSFRIRTVQDIEASSNFFGGTFLDVDQNPATGFAVNDIGADYQVQTYLLPQQSMQVMPAMPLSLQCKDMLKQINTTSGDGALVVWNTATQNWDYVTAIPTSFDGNNNEFDILLADLNSDDGNMNVVQEAAKFVGEVLELTDMAPNTGHGTVVAAVNNPPNTPSNPLPPNHAPNVSIPANLSWVGGDPDAGDTVTYDVYFGTSSPPPFKETIGPYPATQSSITYDPGTLNNDTKYYWKIVATDNHAASTTGPVWDFTTEMSAAQVQVSIAAPDEVAAESEFVATVIISPVESFDSCNYDLSYDPAVIQVTEVTSGSIDGTEIPIDMWGFIPPGIQGTVRVISNVPGVAGVSGEGYLAEIHFHVVGETCNTSELDLHSGKLSDNEAQDIPAEWIDGSVHVSECLPGDVNMDGRVNSVDITKLERIMLMLDPPTPCVDVNGDGNVNSADITKIERIMLQIDY